MILILVCILAVLLIALWLSTMALWWQTEEGLERKTLKRGDVVRHWNKTARLARRSWYESIRYSKKAAVWGNKKAKTVFTTVFPRAKAAFAEQDLLTGLEHGPSSYFLASLSKREKPRRVYARRKKPSEGLQEEQKPDIVA
ncbi:MAG TPA: hypothetical protein VL576_03160 [Candidatus Paceibacterota bacterium]|nr:hypothetical protein [Candidatus Paceibacterota bacterium]